MKLIFIVLIIFGWYAGLGLLAVLFFNQADFFIVDHWSTGDYEYIIWQYPLFVFIGGVMSLIFGLVTSSELGLIKD